MCSYRVSRATASFCAYPAWYIFPRWRRPKTPREPHAKRIKTWERPNRADKNGAPLVPPLVPPRTPRHTPRITEPPTPRPAATHRISPRHTRPPHGKSRPVPPQRSKRHNATRHARRDETRIETTAATRKDETTRQDELTKTAQQDNTDTERQHETAGRNADTERQSKKTQTGRPHETEKRDKNANAPPTRYERRNKATHGHNHRHAHGTPPAGTPPRRRLSPDKPPRRADKNGAPLASPPRHANRHEKNKPSISGERRTGEHHDDRNPIRKKRTNAVRERHGRGTNRQIDLVPATANLPAAHASLRPGAGD